MLYDVASDTEVQLILTCPLPAVADTPVGADGAEPNVILSLELADIFPAASLNQTYTVFVPELLLNVKDMLPEYDVVDVSPLFIKTDGLDGAVVSLPVVAVDSSPLSPCPQPDSARREKIPIIK